LTRQAQITDFCL